MAFLSASSAFLSSHHDSVDGAKRVRDIGLQALRANCGLASTARIMCAMLSTAISGETGKRLEMA